MGAGAAKPGTPAVGGKGAAQPSRPTLAPPGQGSTLPPQGGKTAAPGTILNPNNPNNVPMPGGKAPGAVQPGQPPYMPTGLPPAQPTPVQPGQPVMQPSPFNGPLGVRGNDQPVAEPYRPIGYPPGQPPYMPTGLPPAQVPPQGGKSQAQIDQINADMAAKRTGQPQVPAQGGKAPLTPEQQAALGPYVSPARPQVMPMSPQRDLGYGNQLPPEVQAQINATRNNPQVSPPQGGFPQRDLGYGNPPPRPAPVMPRPAPVIPQPVPGLGLAGLRKPMPKGIK